MLTQRKRFNYNVGSTQSSSSQKKTYISSAIKPNLNTPATEVTVCKFKEDKENNKKVQELEEVNKRLIEETTKQFKKLEADVQRVQKILEEKENALEESHKQNQNLNNILQRVEDEKKILIQAIMEKDLVIREYEEKLKEMLASRNPIHTSPQLDPKPQNEQSGTQTDVLHQTCPKQQLTQVLTQNMEMQQELYRIREQLFDANNKVKVLQQQFQAYKILKQIESVQEV